MTIRKRGERIVTRQVSLAVNNMPIKLDYFVENYVDHVIGGIVGSLHDTGQIDTLELSIDNEGQVRIQLNNADVPLKSFPMEIIKSTIEGIILPLKGVDRVTSPIEVKIER
jgi:hypothetical protein